MRARKRAPANARPHAHLPCACLRLSLVNLRLLVGADSRDPKKTFNPYFMDHARSVSPLNFIFGFNGLRPDINQIWILEQVAFIKIE